MAVTKVSPTVHFVSRGSAVSTRGGSANGRWVPNTDVYVTEEGLVIKVELAGLRREDLEIAVDHNRIVISGHRLDCCRGPNCSFLMMEINYGHFESVIELPTGFDLSRAKAAYMNGFLRVDVPPLEAESEAETSLRNGEC